ncbi:hypothetical protein CCZ01_06985 [Helicobacter monodelphidis]|uniref:hypothetical protein n=1 Tax=Helicobacter sp. 15-1451 TaxID=2004995 RepID=UPI000DCD6B84|nr:hypothetical protein [Helicobacter sp. 15-1451]RAX57200.1 hypothetical protein CCZ01_06985 [Helicobacter sp. 15-1451]
MKNLLALFAILFLCHSVLYATESKLTQSDIDYLIANLSAKERECANRIIDLDTCSSSFHALKKSYQCYKSNDTKECESAKNTTLHTQYRVDSAGYVPEEEEGWYDPHFRFIEDILNLSFIFITKSEGRESMRYFVRTNWALPKGDNNENRDGKMIVSLLADYVNSGYLDTICVAKNEIAQNPNAFPQGLKNIISRNAGHCK